MTIELHTWNTPNGRKISVALEEMGLPYRVHPINISKGEQFAPAFLKISPNNRIPAIVDPDGPGGKPISVFESGAILQYLGRKTGQFYGRDERERVQIEEWMYWQMANLGPVSGHGNHFRNYAPSMTKDSRHLAYGAIRFTNEAERLYGVLNRRLKDREYLCGDYSLADMINWPWIGAWRILGVDFDSVPHVKAWWEKIREREAVKAAIAKGEETRRGPGLGDSGADAEAARKILFGQRARA
jgi:GST-like protein